ncbi:MscL family protein [Streptomyces sp. NPDC028635]|uniref:MscL family protein n=1 Tax=Streptomyces sp. NPDC028635 TaxID=3154800 RepID=UPI00340EAFE8
MGSHAQSRSRSDGSTGAAGRQRQSLRGGPGRLPDGGSVRLYRRARGSRPWRAGLWSSTRPRAPSSGTARPWTSPGVSSAAGGARPQRRTGPHPGIVIGAAFTAVVNGFVSAFLTPLVGLATGATGDMSRKTFTVGATKFPYGAFINAAISFLLLASALYFLVVLPINKLQERVAPHHDVQAPKRGCPECLSPVPAQARRCASCTVALPTVPAQTGETTQRAG